LLSKLTNPRLTYHAESFDLATAEQGGRRLGEVQRLVELDQPGRFRHSGAGATDATTVISVNSAESVLTPALGLMIVTFDNKSGTDEAQLIRVDVK